MRLRPNAQSAYLFAAFLSVAGCSGVDSPIPDGTDGFGGSPNVPTSGGGTSNGVGGTGNSTSSDGGSTSAGVGGALVGTGGDTNSGGSASSSGGSDTGGAAATGGAGSGGATGTGGAGQVCTSAPWPSGGTPLAFPEAQGFGRNATGGRGGKVYHVTNLNDSGAGSFRDAVSASNRIVVFDVGGYIQLKTAVSAKSNLTIDGQSAPGGGIGFRGGEISFAKSSNVILRYVRIRPGSETASSTDDAISLYRARNVIIDHTTMAFAPWNNIGGVSDDWQLAPVTDITFQDSLIANPTGQQFGAHTESVASNWSWYRNVFANSHNRNPLAKVNNVFVNNVLYNCSAGYTTHTSTNFKHDIVNNYFIFGPASTGTDNTWYQVDKNQSIYYAGNLKDKDLNGALNGTATTPYWYQGAGTILNAAWSAGLATTTYDAASAYRITASGAGALPRDTSDALVFAQVATLGKGTTGTGVNTRGPDGGLYTSQAQTGLANNGYGAIAAGTKATDTDNDGMPDFWESATGSSLSVDDAMTKATDGYALIEHYLNWLGAPHASTKTNTAVDIDLSKYTSGFSGAAPTFTITSPSCASAALKSDGHTVTFQPSAGFKGLVSFDVKVKGTDGTHYEFRLGVTVGS